MRLCEIIEEAWSDEDDLEESDFLDDRFWYHPETGRRLDLEFDKDHHHRLLRRRPEQFGLSQEECDLLRGWQNRDYEQTPDQTPQSIAYRNGWVRAGSEAAGELYLETSSLKAAWKASVALAGKQHYDQIYVDIVDAVGKTVQSRLLSGEGLEWFLRRGSFRREVTESFSRPGNLKGNPHENCRFIFLTENAPEDPDAQTIADIQAIISEDPDEYEIRAEWMTFRGPMYQAIFWVGTFSFEILFTPMSGDTWEVSWRPTGTTRDRLFALETTTGKGSGLLRYILRGVETTTETFLQAEEPGGLRIDGQNGRLAEIYQRACSDWTFDGYETQVTNRGVAFWQDGADMDDDDDDDENEDEER